MVFPYTLGTANKILAKFDMKQLRATSVGAGYFALLGHKNVLCLWI